MVKQLTSILLILFVKARITVELTWNTEKLSYSSCQNKNQLLFWNFTEGVNETIMELQWFFNETILICLDSRTIGFHVDTLYHSRVERKGTTEIVLKNISLKDAGKYTLYVKLAKEKIRNIQHIVLTVYEQVPYHCIPVIETLPENVLHCSTNCSERSKLSPKWIINSTQDPEVIEPNLRINTGINEQSLSCLHSLMCHDDDQFKCCKPNTILFKVFTEDIRTRRPSEANIVKATNDDSNKTSNVIMIMGVSMICILCVFVFVFVVTCLTRRGRNSSDVRPRKTITAEECTEVLTHVDLGGGTTDRSLHHSNSSQNIQIVNNVIMDGIYLEVFREEISELKRQLSNNKHSKILLPSNESFEMTEIKCQHPNDNDTETSETTSDYEDAASELLVHHDWSGSIHSCLPSEYPSSDQH